MKMDATPAEIYGPLLARVQESGILSDSKAFVDAVPLRPIAAIMADFAQIADSNQELLSFVLANFVLPPAADEAVPAQSVLPLRAYIRSMWPKLAREPETGSSNSSAMAIGHRHVVPGGRFREIYYWDSFFTLLGLVRDGEMALANGIVDAMTDFIEDHGHVPNGSRTYYIGRSQPPVFHMMVALLDDKRPAVVARRLAAMKREHAWWMADEDEVMPGQAKSHVARLADGSLLNRYWDPRDTPRDESWREDVETARESGRKLSHVYRDLRAGAESGWDFSSRWLEGNALASIRTTAIAPVDLNAFLFGLETAIAAAGGTDAPVFADRAARRRAAMLAHLWNDAEGFFADYDLEKDCISSSASAASLVPLATGLASQEHADATARFVRDKLLAAGGLRTTLIESGQQWDRPNGWAPLQWIAVTGLLRYGHGALATEVADRWIATVGKTYDRTGLLYEKYNVETSEIGGGGEYDPQVGFGWTNGVTADLIDMAAGRLPHSGPHP
jgi:alpha,alpha-trehalase